MLSHLFSKEESLRRLKGIKVGLDAPSISNLLFANDLLLFGKATIREATTLEECLGKYMAWSGQKVNRDKSLVHFSKNFLEQAMVSILDQLCLKKLPTKVKYLGLPFLIPKAKVGVANEIKAKFL